MYVTEDTTRADPETLRQLYSAAIRAGASRVCVADTVGHATPAGAAAVVRFVGEVVDECGGGIGIDWHGHRDRDFAVVNTLAALEAGATRLHGAAIGIGERVGNTPMDMLLVNLVLMGYIERDLSALVEYCDAVSAATGVPIPAELSGRRPRCVPYCDRRARGGGHQGVPQAGSRRWSTRCTQACRRHWSAASRRSKSGRCRADRTWSSGSRSAGSRRATQPSTGSSPPRRASDCILTETAIRALLSESQ